MKLPQKTHIIFCKGVWGSAFSILFNRLVAKTKPGDSDGKQKTKEAIDILREEQMQGKRQILV